MEVLIAFRPETAHGPEILDALERQSDLPPDHVMADGTRRYHVDAPDADIDYFDSTLDRIDPQWRNHLTGWRVDDG